MDKWDCIFWSVVVVSLVTFFSLGILTTAPISPDDGSVSANIQCKDESFININKGSVETIDEFKKRVEQFKGC